MFALLLAVAAAGCSRPASERGGRGEGKPAEQAAQKANPGVPVAAISPEKLPAVVEKYRGKVLLIDYWATWCEPCKELFPHTVALSREFGDRGLAVVSLSLDDEEEEAAVRKFLTANGATFENLRATTGASSESTDRLGIPGGALPFFQLYDRAGKLRKTFPAPVKPAEVDRAVRQLLAETSHSA